MPAENTCSMKYVRVPLLNERRRRRIRFPGSAAMKAA